MLSASVEARPRFNSHHVLMSMPPTLASQNSDCKQCFKSGRQNLAMHIGKRIKNVMKDRRISTKEMAEHCEVTPGAVSNWFATGKITKENLLLVAKRLEVDVSDLISGEVGERGTDVPLVLSQEERDIILAIRQRRDAREPVKQAVAIRRGDPIAILQAIVAKRDPAPKMHRVGIKRRKEDSA